MKSSIVGVKIVEGTEMLRKKADITDESGCS